MSHVSRSVIEGLKEEQCDFNTLMKALTCVAQGLTDGQLVLDGVARDYEGRTGERIPHSVLLNCREFPRGISFYVQDGKLMRAADGYRVRGELDKVISKVTDTYTGLVLIAMMQARGLGVQTREGKDGEILIHGVC
tara:strand:+ start:7074 stop:7481 length:408 start_codon:yes stop_codon:yes gene_type:complete